MKNNLHHRMTPYESIVLNYIQKDKKDCRLEGVIMKDGNPDFFIPSSNEWVEAKYRLFTPLEIANLIHIKEKKATITILSLEGTCILHLEITKIVPLSKNEMIVPLTCNSNCPFEYDLQTGRHPPYKCPICDTIFMNRTKENYLNLINQKFPVTPVGSTG